LKSKELRNSLKENLNKKYDLIGGSLSEVYRNLAQFQHANIVMASFQNILIKSSCAGVFTKNLL